MIQRTKNLLIKLALCFCYFTSFAQQKDFKRVVIKSLGTPINSPFMDYAPLISNNGKKLIFTSRKPLVEKKNKTLKDNIYYSNFDSTKNSWSEPLLFTDTINMPGRNNSAIALSADDDRMLIYRDDINANGDMYESRLIGKNWATPVNLGKPINSPNRYSETSASIAPDGRTIYFVSTRIGGLGGKDIWYCTKNPNGKWGNAINMGDPINSTEDEESGFMDQEGRTLFFSSKGHNSLGGYDVFMSQLDDNTKKWSAPQNLGAPINTTKDDMYFVMQADEKTAYYSSARTGGAGEKDIYRIDFIEDKDAVIKNLTMLKAHITSEKDSSDVADAKITVKEISKEKEISKIKTVGTFSTNFITGQYLILLPQGKKYKIEVAANGYGIYTETIDVPTKTFSEEITKHIVLKLINAFVSGKTLDEDGNPIKADVEAIDKVTNKVIGKSQSSGSTGMFKVGVISGKSYGIVLSKHGHLFQIVNVEIPDSAGYEKVIKDKDIVLPKAEVGKKIVLNNIFFDYDKATLRNESVLELEQAVKLMSEMVSLKVEISGHTDSIGAVDYNQKLSERRAKAVVGFLISNGVDKKRLDYKGFGLSQPVAQNATEKGRQLNRRTEFKVMKVDIKAEQKAEMKQLREIIVLNGKQSGKINAANESSNKGNKKDNNNSLPERFKLFDQDGNGKISNSEIINAIDSFLDRKTKVDMADISAMVDYYFEQ